MKPLARKNQLIVEELAGECVVYDTNRKKAHSLNSTLTWIWRHCDGSMDIDEIASLFEREFGCVDALDVVQPGIHQLYAADLLASGPEAADAMPIPGPIVSRRSVVAAGSAFVPVIASILVPTAAAAKSKPDKPKPPKGKK